MAKKIGVISKGASQKAEQAAYGIYEKLVITEVPDAAALSLLGKRLEDAGALTVAGDYYCDADIAGIASLEVSLRTSAQSGTAVTPDAYVTFQDGSTKRGTSATGFAALAAGVSDEGALTVPAGARVLRVKLTIAGASSSTFDRAEVSGL